MTETQHCELELWLVQPTSSRSFPLPRSGRVIIGRAPECDIVIDDPSVSRRHAALVIGESLSVEDLASANGTWLHPQPASAPLAVALQGPTSTRPGLVSVRAGVPQSLGVGQALMVGAMLMVVRPNANSVAQPAQPSDPAQRNAPILRDPQMIALFATAERVAASHLSVLILGETGVGKEILAETIHRRSPRADKPLVRLHCAALAATLLESELFGHEQGAFTGAVRAKVGLLQAAEGGTVFLDEVGELPADVQVKLLRVLEDRTFTRVGGLKPIRIDVRFVAATNRDLRREVSSGRFREDLLYRLDGVTLLIPPLRERRVEIPDLARSFVKDVSRSLGLRQAPKLSAESLASLVEREWPGNVRELRQLIERAVVLCQGDTLTPVDLLPSLSSSPSMESRVESDAAPAPRANADGQPGPLRDQIAVLERQRIIEALDRSAGNQSRAAELLGISRRTLVTRLATLGIPRPRTR